MAAYKNYGEIETHPLFAEFVKQTLGLDDVTKVDMLDRGALFYAFRYKIGDLDAEETKNTSMYYEKEPNDEIKKFAEEKLGKKFEDFTNDEKIFAAVSYITRKNAENLQEKINETESAPEKTDETDTQLLNANAEGERFRSYNSDTNDDMLYDARLEILQNKGLIKGLKPEDTDTRDKVIKLVKSKLEEMSADERQAVEDEIFAKMIADEALFAIMPPKKLAEAYKSYSDRAEKATDEDEKSALLSDKEKVGKRIDDLTDMLIRDAHYSSDLFFTDNTNIADVYKGYNEMFAARMNDLPEGDARRDKMTQGANALNLQYDEYLKTWNLQDLKPENAKDLNKRFEKIESGLQKVVLNDEIAKTPVSDSGTDLGTLLSNFKYLDADGNIEPQFIDADGKKTDVYTSGAKVIKGSKLEQSITLAKQLFIQNNLAGNDELTPEMMQAAITEYLPTVMYITHVKSNIEKGLAENVDQFTNPAYLQEFKNSLGRVDQPMQISHNAFEQAKQSIINNAYAFRDVVADKITDAKNPKDSPENKSIVHNLCRNLIPLDVRRDMRYEKRVTNDVWGNYASEVLQGTVAAAVGTARIRGAMILTSAAAGAATGIATGTLMLGASAVVPAALSIKQYISCRNELKKSGKPCGFADVFKNKNFLASLGTTALTEAAIACAFMPVPGARVAAVALGGAAITIGITRAAMNDYKKLRAAGKSKWKAMGAALFGGALKAGVAYLVGHELQAAAQDAGMFQETVKVKDAQEEISHEEWRYDDNVAAKAHRTLESFYGHNDDALNHDLEQIKAQLHAMHRDDIPPEVFLRNAVDAGMNTGVDTVNHVQGGPDVHTNGNNTVMTKAWAAEHDINYDDVKNLASIKDADGNIHIDENALKGFDNTKHMVNTNNTVGHTSNTEYQDDGVNKKMASVDEKTGRVVTDNENPDRYKTYADGDNGLHKEKIIDQEAQEAVYETRTVESPYTEYAYGMLGVRNGGWMHKIARRVGALTDWLRGKQKDVSEPQKQDVPPTNDIPPVKQDIPPVKQDNPPVKTDEKNPAVEPEIIVREVQPVKIPSEEGLLDKEYKLVYGAKTAGKKALAEYKKLVVAEYEKARENGTTKADFAGYLQERREMLNQTLADSLGVDSLDKAKKSDVVKLVNEARNMAVTSRMGFSEGADGHIKDVTLLTLNEFAVVSQPAKDRTMSGVSKPKTNAGHSI